jgi:hypothetical protein
MINIKLHKNEIKLIKESIESSKFLGYEPKLCDRILKKIDKALTIPDVSQRSELLSEEYENKLEKGVKELKEAMKKRGIKLP